MGPKTRWWPWVFLALAACSRSSEDTPGDAAASVTATAAPTRTGAWSVAVEVRTKDGKTSARRVRLRDGEVSVEGTKRPSEKALDTIAETLESTDWKKMELRLSLEGAVPAGPITTISVEHGGASYELATADPGKYPALAALVKATGGR